MIQRSCASVRRLGLLLLAVVCAQAAGSPGELLDCVDRDPMLESAWKISLAFLSSLRGGEPG